MPVFPGAFPPGFAAMMPPPAPPQPDSPFHPLSPGAVPTATPLHSLPGSFDSRQMTSAAAAAAATSPMSPHPAEVRAFQAAWLQAQACSSLQERARCMERLLNSSRAQANIAQQLSKLRSGGGGVKEEQLGKLDLSHQGALLRQRMQLAFDKDDNMWRPW